MTKVIKIWLDPPDLFEQIQTVLERNETFTAFALDAVSRHLQIDPTEHTAQPVDRPKRLRAKPRAKDAVNGRFYRYRTFRLDAEIDKRIRAEAKRRKMTASQLYNRILVAEVNRRHLFN